MSPSYRPFIENGGQTTAEMQAAGNGRPGFDELGTAGLQAWAGFLRQAYHAELRWPEVFPLFDRLRRSDPEIAIIRMVLNSLARSVSIEVELPDQPTDVDRRAQEFVYTVLEDIEHGIQRWRDATISYVPYHGWGWWEILPGLRRSNWTPPPHHGEPDPWRSKYNDGLIGLRRLAWRDQSSFYAWDISDRTGRLRGLKQLDVPNPPVTIPLERSVHLTFGDTESPEGLSPLESVWRLERIKYGLELVQGIGFEHAAGYLNVTSEKPTLTAEDHAIIKRAARSIMAVQEGNYAAWPMGITGELKDVPFAAAESILAAIRYYGLLKLQVFMMAWVAIASTAGTGSYSAAEDLSGMFVQVYNAMMSGFVDQLNRQLIPRLFEWNAAAFPGLIKLPRLYSTAIEKAIPLAELGNFANTFFTLFPSGPEDIIALRRRSGFLPVTLPARSAAGRTPQAAAPSQTETAETETAETETTEMQQRPVVLPANERPLDITYQAAITDADVRAAMRAFQKWAADNYPQMAEWLAAKPKPAAPEAAGPAGA